MRFTITLLFFMSGVGAVAGQTLTNTTQGLNDIYDSVRAAEEFFKVTFKDEVTAQYYMGPFGHGECGRRDVPACYNEQRKKVYQQVLAWEQFRESDQTILKENDRSDNLLKKKAAIDRLNSVLNNIRAFDIGITSPLSEWLIVEFMNMVYEKDRALRNQIEEAHLSVQN